MGETTSRGQRQPLIAISVPRQTEASVGFCLSFLSSSHLDDDLARAVVVHDLELPDVAWTTMTKAHTRKKKHIHSPDEFARRSSVSTFVGHGPLRSGLDCVSPLGVVVRCYNPPCRTPDKTVRLPKLLCCARCGRGTHKVVKLCARQAQARGARGNPGEYRKTCTYWGAHQT